MVFKIVLNISVLTFGHLLDISVIIYNSDQDLMIKSSSLEVRRVITKILIRPFDYFEDCNLFNFIIYLFILCRV